VPCLAVSANTGQQVIRGGVNGGNINALMETVEFVIDSPQVASRNYTAFNWAKYDWAFDAQFL
jgi:hypothetical protein